MPIACCGSAFVKQSLSRSVISKIDSASSAALYRATSAKSGMSDTNQAQTTAHKAGEGIGTLLVLLVSLLLIAVLWYMVVALITPIGGGDQYTSDYAAFAIQLRMYLLGLGYLFEITIGGVALYLTACRISVDTQNERLRRE